MQGGLFSQYVNNLSGRRSVDEDSPNNPVEMLFRNGIEQVTIEMVLSEQDCINACKWGNEKLEKFFTRDKVKQMLKYILEMPPQGCSHNRGHTMPFVASEIFSCEMASITSKFFTPENIEEKEFVDYKMSPVSGFRISDEDREELEKNDLEINFNDDCDVEMSDPNSFGTQIRTADECQVEQFQVNEVEQHDIERENLNEELKTPQENDSHQTNEIEQRVADVTKLNASKQSSPARTSLSLQLKKITSTPNTIKTGLSGRKNKFELFEDFLAFIETQEELNSVLCGYWCKLFKVLVGSHPREVFNYFYLHEEIIEKLIRHLYQPAVCEVISRLLNFNKTIFAEDQASSPQNRSLNEVGALEIRNKTLFAVIERLGPDYSFEQKLGALQVLKELPNNQILTELLTSSRCMQRVQDFLQTEDQEVKSSTFQFLSCLLDRIFPSNQQEPEKQRFISAKFANPFEEAEQVMPDLEKRTAITEDFFEFLSLVVIEVVPFVLRLDQQESLDCQQTQYNQQQRRLGMTRLHTLEFLDLVQSKLGTRMRAQLKEADIYSILVQYFEVFPFNDLALSKVFKILATALDSRFKRNKIELIKLNADTVDAIETIEDDQTRHLEQEILVHMLYQTDIISQLITLSQQKSKVSFQQQRCTGMGFMAYTIELGLILKQLGSQNPDVQECLNETCGWSDFVENTLNPIVDIRKGSLYDDPRLPKADSEEGNFIQRLVDNFKLKSPPSKKTNDGAQKLAQELNLNSGYQGDDTEATNQEDMDRLIQPYLSYSDEEEEEEVKESFQVNEVPHYDIRKYSSNDNVKKLSFQEDDAEEGGSIMELMELKEKQRANNSRYAGFGMIKTNNNFEQKKQKSSEVLGVTGVDFDSDEEEKDQGRYKRATKDSDDDDIERDESLSLDALDGWMIKINTAREEAKQQLVQNKTDDQDIEPDDHSNNEDEDEFDFITAHIQKRTLTQNDDLKREESFGQVLKRHDEEQFPINLEPLHQESVLEKIETKNIGLAANGLVNSEDTDHFFQNTYWKLPETDDIQEMLKDYV